MKQDNYLRAMRSDSELAHSYFAKSIDKTEQQKALESLLLDSIYARELDLTKPYEIADLACGGETLSHYLASLFPNAPLINNNYNTYCTKTIANLCEDKSQSIRIVPFQPGIDLERDKAMPGIGSFTLAVNMGIV